MAYIGYRCAMTNLSKAKRIVIKIGSALLVDRTSGLKQAWLDSIAEDIAGLRLQGSEVLLVSSGAIALGRNVLGLPPRPLRLDESQAAAAVGQISLARAWSEALDRRGLNAGQILLTVHDTEGSENRRTYINARDTIERLLGFGAIPVVNENDTIATSEIRYGDNDRLAARVATMVGADLLVLLSDIDGLYSAPPNLDPSAQFIDYVDDITPEIEAMAGSAGSELSRGGMVTKIEAARIATRAGTNMVIASGHSNNPLRALSEGGKSTWFSAQLKPGPARKAWISGQLALSGSVIIDAGALGALARGKSLLPAGVRSIEGEFSRGDVIAIRDEKGQMHGRGLVAYDAREARLIAGRKSDELETVLGYEGRSTMIHRDDMALTLEHSVDDQT